MCYFTGPNIHLSTVGSYHGFLKATARSEGQRFPFKNAVKNIEFLIQRVLQGSVIMPLRCGGPRNIIFVEQSVLNALVKKFCKSVNVCQSYNKSPVAPFL